MIFTLACAIVILALAPLALMGFGLVLCLVLLGAVVFLIWSAPYLLLKLAAFTVLLVLMFLPLNLLDRKRFRSTRHTPEEEASMREIATNGWCDDCQRCHPHAYSLR